jgi:hypothetical protein
MDLSGGREWVLEASHNAEGADGERGPAVLLKEILATPGYMVSGALRRRGDL